jgi:hypothetical protein
VSIQLAARYGVEAIFYSALGFIAVVSLFWPWWKTQLGWTFAAKSAALALATLPAMVHVWVGGATPAWLAWLGVAALWAVPPILVWRAWVLWRVQRTRAVLHPAEPVTDVPLESEDGLP